ncbi:MAG TPA: glycosyltransferase family 4 protein [Puia sp.]|nr:glycosyltransferase family 4 protein [Puia sp.]
MSMTTPATRARNALYILGNIYPHLTGGMEIFNYYFLRERAKRPGGEIYFLNEYSAENPAVHFVRLKQRWPVRLFRPFQYFLAICRLRKEADYAYISYAEQSWVISFSQALALRCFRIPYIVTIHWGKEPEWKFKFPWLYFFRHAHTVVGVSEPICKAFEGAVPGQSFSYIPPLIPFQRSKKNKTELKAEFGFREDERILLFVGSLKTMKNPHRVVEAFQVLGRSWLDEHRVRLLFVGSGDLGESLRETAVHSGLRDYVRFAGQIGRERIADYYGVADAYIISSDYEGTSLSLLEAMFNGMPILASNAPGINTMLRHEQNALLYETGNVIELAGTVKRLFTNHSLARRLASQAALDFNRQYAYEGMMKKYDLIFSSVS